MTKVRKAVIAAAGMGTRFLPQTKAMPKEMLPIVDKPIIQKIVEDVVEAGVTDVIIVTSSQKRSIEDHFDRHEGLEHKLRKKGKDDAADELSRIANLANFAYIRQKGKVIGNAVPLLNASHLIGDEPFFYLFADDYFEGEVAATLQMLKAYEETKKTVLPLIEIESSQSEKYGIVEVENGRGNGIYDITHIVEKPSQEDAPSNLASVHGYLFTPDILRELKKAPLSDRGELEIQWAIDQLAQNGEICGIKINGQWRDAGNKQGYVYAIVESALADEELGPQLRQYLKKRLQDN